MLNNPVLVNSSRFILLVLAQVLVFNHLNFFGTINPMVYVLFFFWYPVKENNATLMLTAFALGLVIDIFSDTMALHTLAAITLAYFRPFMMRFCFGINFDFQNFSFKNATVVQRMTFLFLLIILQNMVFFFLEILSFSHITLILKQILFTTLATFLFCSLLIVLFSKNQE
ncbi:Rod shape-determining protein MreD [Croceitalea dokdonensis DOKDO 023]|uniref:Rod shape-determining protein MreD n=1 Tax=Croceitalea dokdonensis DOKDO 023 TaxID=1300341 RepID=A0A0P7AL92_9FLAO|nr:hypothetical protein [Croceitalea dokdonensis]KPM32646.1 Rod shape-determining protein MreD [Croceitalea dokdonensis DOKDO 023]